MLLSRKQAGSLCYESAQPNCELIVMELGSSKQLTSLLDNKSLSRLERMRIIPTRHLTNRTQGEHLSGRGGTSTEFSDYRIYVEGDDIRHVDWNIFSRLHRPFVKLFQFEEEMHVVILLDASASMQFEGKFQRARQLAAAFGVMGLMNVERVSVYSCGEADGVPARLPPCTGRVSMNRLLQFLEGLDENGGDFPIEQAVDAVLKRHRGRGVAVLLSDFLTLGDLVRPLNLLHSAGLEIFGLQVLSPAEIDPDITGDLRFVDSETGKTLDVSSGGDLLPIYHEHRLAMQKHLEDSCRKRGGRFLSISSQDAGISAVRSAAKTGVDSMSFPSFFAPSAAWLFLLAVPLIVFYFLKLKRPRTKIPSLALWSQVINDRRVNSPFQKFKRHLLLLLQLLLLLVVVLAAMQPFSQSATDRAQYVPILVDCSASMAAVDEATGKSRLDLAREQIGELIDNMLPDQRLMLIAFDSTARSLTEFTDNKRLLRAALPELEIADVPSDPRDALLMTQALFRATQPPFQRVLMFTDGNIPDTVDFDLPFELVYQQLPPASPNIGIGSLNARRTGEQNWAVFVSITGSASAKSAANVRLLRDGDEIGNEAVVLEAGQPRQLVFEVEVRDETHLEVRLEPESFDSLAADNIAFIDLPIPRPVSVYVPSGMTTFRRAANVLPGVDLYPKDDGDEELSKYDLVISDRDQKLTPAAAVRLSVGVIADDLSKLLSVGDEGATLVDWRRDSPLLQHVQLNELVITDRPESREGVLEQDFEQLGYEILAHGREGPLVLKKREDADVAFHLLFHTDRSSLPYRIGFSILVQNLVQIARQQASLSEAHGHQTGVLPDQFVTADQTYNVTRPDGSSLQVRSDPQGRLAGVPARSIGQYTVMGDDGEVARIGVSLLDDRETQLTTVEEIQFGELSVTAQQDAVPTDRPLWHLLALAGFVLMLIEWWYFQTRSGRIAG